VREEEDGGEAMTQAESIVASLALRAEHYAAFRAWCQKCWSGCAHGYDLTVITLPDPSRALLRAAEASGWIRRGTLSPRPGQRYALGIPDELDFFHWEPDRNSPSYCEFIAFIQLERCVFEPLVERWRHYAIETEKAELSAAHNVGAAHHANWERDRAEKLKATAKRRARLMAKGRRNAERAIKNGVGPAVNACAAALPLVAHTIVSAQLRYSLKNAEAWTGIVPLESPAWDIGDVE
jgi:hypothetical protein